MGLVAMQSPFHPSRNRRLLRRFQPSGVGSKLFLRFFPTPHELTVRVLAALSILGLWTTDATGAGELRQQKFSAATPEAARSWQASSRNKLYELMMGGRKPERVALDSKVLARLPVSAGGYVLEQVSIQTLPGRRINAWVALPTSPHGRVGAVLALHGHGGRADLTLRGDDRFWYGRALAEMGYVVIAPDLGSHQVNYPGWSLMGERVWNALRCLDYASTLPSVDTNRLAAVGLELGAETAMYAAALDERIRMTVCSSWLSTTANLKAGHCPCWKFPGLEENFEFSDIFASIAPRPLWCEAGDQESAPGGFPAALGQQAFGEIQAAYGVLGAGDQAHWTVHPGGMAFHGYEAWAPLQTVLGRAWPWQAGAGSGVDELLRRGEIARRCFVRAAGVLEGWWRLRDAQTGLCPRQMGERVWAPGDNGGVLLPAQLATAELLVPSRMPEVLRMLRTERSLTSYLGPLPDWYDLTNHVFLYPEPEITRILADSAHYAQGGLLPVTELLGRGDWLERLRELLDGIIARAPIPSAFGHLPSTDSRINGEILQAAIRVYAMTREPRYLELSLRIGDAYGLEVLPKNGFLPPRQWDFQRHAVVLDELDLHDHGYQLLAGLAEAFRITGNILPKRAEAWRSSLSAMFRRLVGAGRNDDGLLVYRLQASTGDVLNGAAPAAGFYALVACLNCGQAVNDESLTDAARKALRALNQPRYLDWDGGATYATALDGVILLLNRLPEAAGFSWLEQVLPLFLRWSRENGLVEGWYGDGQYARAALLVGQYYTQGARCRPWRADLRLGAVREGKNLRLALAADQDWEGRVLFDGPRHLVPLRLPADYPRLGEFPEWYTVDPQGDYRLQIGKSSRRGKGFDLNQGVPVSVKAGQSLLIEVAPSSP